MGFILDGLDSESYDRTYTDTTLVKRLLKYFSEHKLAMIFVSFSLLLQALAGSAGPVIISKAIDVISNNPSYFNILTMSALLIFIGVVGWIFNYIRQMISAHLIGNVVFKLRTDMFKKVIEYDLSFYDEQASGKIVSRITSDTQDFTQIIALVTDFLSQFLLVIILVFWIFSINFWLSLILIGMAPIAVLIALQFRKAARKVTRNAKKIRATINSQIQESFSGIMIAKAFRQEKTLYKTFNENNKKSYKVNIQRGIILNLIFPLVGACSGVATAVIVYTGGLGVKHMGLTPGTWYLFMQAMWFFWWPILNIASFWSQFQDGLSAAERVFALIDREPKVTQNNNQPVDEIDGKIDFNNVTFSYTEKEKVLDNFSLSIKPGEILALVGHTGAGKSSIARLVTRFYEYQTGTILIDDNDIRDLDLSTYREHIGLVPQVPFLFSGTVKDNIKYGNPDATDEEVVYAATHVGKGDWLHDLPEGLDTNVGHRGARLSMGQRQLVALARILLKNPKIFILDEATASVDPFTEVQIQEGLNTVMQSRTAIVIAHRLSTVKNADRIIVIEKGKIIEEGTHNHLLSQKGHYAELYNTYFRHQSMEYIESGGPRA